VKSLKRFDLNLNLKGCFEKGLKKKKRKKTNPAYLLAQRPSSPLTPPRSSPRPATPFSFLFFH
jgi:hypothetical protein